MPNILLSITYKVSRCVYPSPGRFLLFVLCIYTWVCTYISTRAERDKARGGVARHSSWPGKTAEIQQPRVSNSRDDDSLERAYGLIPHSPLRFRHIRVVAQKSSIIECQSYVYVYVCTVCKYIPTYAHLHQTSTSKQSSQVTSATNGIIEQGQQGTETCKKALGTTFPDLGTSIYSTLQAAR
ncbi:hypothetical protein F5Y04DRAFT_263406 [Hypomontagnella monticulosa]|nr:hypothetical protein F5Y04DRAFT_263406 [Hypomontagnella monticulosa]